MIYQILSLSLAFALFISFFLFRRLLKKTIMAHLITEAKIQRELNILTDQYRQVANINKALRDVESIKVLPKKK
jgi:hypothetical protein